MGRYTSDQTVRVILDHQAPSGAYGGPSRAIKSNPKFLERERRRKHCALAVVRLSQKKNFAPPQTPFPGARDGQNLISWRWSLPSPIQTQFSEDRCTQFRGTVVTDPPTHTHPQTVPITQYTAPQLARMSVIT